MGKTRFEMFLKFLKFKRLEGSRLPIRKFKALRWFNGLRAIDNLQLHPPTVETVGYRKYRKIDGVKCGRKSTSLFLIFNSLFVISKKLNWNEIQLSIP